MQKKSQALAKMLARTQILSDTFYHFVNNEWFYDTVPPPPERESILNLCRPTVNLRRPERSRNEGTTGPKRLDDHDVQPISDE